MAGQIDENGFPDFTADFDGRLIAASGGRSGDLVLLNGQTITFPWKPQQEVAGSSPAAIYVIDSLDGALPLEWMVVEGAKLNTESQTRSPKLVLASYYANGNEPYASLAAGPHNITVSGGGQIVVASSDLIIGNTLDFRVDADDQVVINGATSVTITSDGASGDITIDAVGDLLLEGGIVTVTSISGAVDINAASGQQMTLDTSGGGDIFLTAAGAGGSIVIDAADVITIDAATSLTLVDGTVSVVVGDLFGPWTTFTPSITQGVTVSKTTPYSKYVKLGQTVIWKFHFNITGSGTGGNAVSLTLPFTSAIGGNLHAGHGYFYPTGPTNTDAIWYFSSTTAIVFMRGDLDAGATAYTGAMASGMTLTGTIIYEAA